MLATPSIGMGLSNPFQSSASGLLAMLSEDDKILKTAALKQLLKVVDTVWHEIAESLPELEAMAEDTSSSSSAEMRETAAAVASRVFFHLGEPCQALRLALESNGTNFNVNGEKRNVYVETLISAAIDAYVKLQRKGSSVSDDNEEVEDDGLAGLELEKLQKVVEAMFERCYADGQYSHALGVALEARNVEKVREVLERCPPPSSGKGCSTLQYALKAVLKDIESKSFRDNVLEAIAERLHTMSGTLNKSAILSLCMCQQLLHRSEDVANTVTKLLESSEHDSLLAYQICFELVDSGDQNFICSVAGHLPAHHTDTSHPLHPRFLNANKVLVGGFCSELSLTFLHSKSDSDPLVMLNLKKTLEDRGGARNSLLHNCAVVTHAYLNAGTTNDLFLRDHLDWMRKASNWSKFSATASLGLIHAGHTTQAMTLLEPYLPQLPEESVAAAPSATGGYAEGGSLFALGLIHGSHSGSSSEKRNEATLFLRNHLRASHANEVISHGAALGVGLTAFANADLQLVHELKDLLYTDSAVAGEAAGLGIGLVLAGTGAGNSTSPTAHSPLESFDELSDTVAELKNYARETQHEKIIRGISIGMALINYGQQENADALIEEMRNDRDPILRYGAMYTIALAYVGTGSNKAVRLLLHTAVSDVSDDVRMAAVIGIAFVLYKTPHRVPQLVKLLLESFNPHVRYASCMAVGIAMAGTGDSDAVSLLEPMLEDMTDFVRQGALLGTSMVYMQCSDTTNNKKIKSFRERLITIVGDKHQSTLTKMGAVLSTGIIDAGGRNCALDLGSRSNRNFTSMTSAVGLVLWLQHWYWYPLMHMFSLALTPSFTIGLNKDLKYPKSFSINCQSKPSVFAYPKRLEEKKEEKKKRVETVTLSTTAKNKARLARKRAKEEASDAMDVDGKKEVEEDNQEEQETSPIVVEEKKKKKREPEPTSYTVSNPSRITALQSEYCSFSAGQRYTPICPEAKPIGVVILTDSTPEEEETEGDLGDAIKAPSSDEDEGDMPEPFEWAPPNHTDYVEPALPCLGDKSSESDKPNEAGGSSDSNVES